jgi:hypothetical protein
LLFKKRHEPLREEHLEELLLEEPEELPLEEPLEPLRAQA